MQPGVLKALGAVGAAEVIGRTRGALANNIIEEAAERAEEVADLLKEVEETLTKKEEE